MGNTLTAGTELDALYLKRSERLGLFIVEKLNPFKSPIEDFVEVQANVVKILEQLTMFEFFIKCSIKKQIRKKASAHIVSEASPNADITNDVLPAVSFEHLQKYNGLLVKALHFSAPLAVKVEAFNWICKFCEAVIDECENADRANYTYEVFRHVGVVGSLVFSVLDAASDREPKVRIRVTSVLELLLQANLIHPTLFCAISEVSLEKLGDPDNDIKNAFVRILSQVLPITLYVCGLYDGGTFNNYRPGVPTFGDGSNLHWRQVFALKQLPQQLHSQQLVSILSFISQRWKVPLSSWLPRLICTCCSLKGSSLTQIEETRNSGVNGLGLEIKADANILETTCSVNNLAGAWWAIHEAARYCITTRLRTNLGGPTQTFAALERMLVDIAHVLQLDIEQSDGNLNIIGSSNAHLLPMRLLLEFVEALKKNVYNAYDGSTVLPCASRQSSLFFRANRKVCEEWFSRICEPMMNAGLALQCHHATIHYCTSRLVELRNLVASALKDKPRAQSLENLNNIWDRFSEDILRVLRHMALALCKSHESEALTGLLKWVKMTFSSLLMDDDRNVSNSEDLGPFSWISGLVYQAQGKYEKAAAHFTHLLQTEESFSSMGSDGVQFTIARIIESYAAVSDWKSLESWLMELQTLRTKHAGKSYSGALTTAGNEINAIHALACFDEGDFQAAWAYLDLTPKSSSELTLDPKLALQRSEQMLLQAMLLQTEGKVEKVSAEVQKAKLMLEEALSVLPLDGLAESAAYATQLHSILAFEESCKPGGSQDNQLHRLLSSFAQILQSPMNQIHQDCNMWLKVLRVFRTITPSSPVTLKLAMNLSILARRQGNLLLANRLNNYLRDCALACSDGRYHEFLVTNLQYESILLMHAENKVEDAFASLWSFLHPCIVMSSSIASDANNNILNAKACLKLSDWLRRDYAEVDLENIVLKMLADFNITETSSLGWETGLNDEKLKCKPNLGLIIEELVGTATKLSTRLCPFLGKSWISYGSWCYNQARASLLVPNESALHSCSFSSVLALEVLPNRFKLTENELSDITSIVLQLLQKGNASENLNKNMTENNFQTEYSENLTNENYVKGLVQRIGNTIEAAAGATGAESSNGECLSAVLASQLKKCLLCSNLGLDEYAISASVDDLINIWWSLRKRRVSLFGHASQAFIRYLSYSSSKNYDGQVDASVCKSLSQKTVSYTLRATLYVLNILLNYGVELKETLEPALSTAPLLPWQEITPQLFSRLSSHPEQAVRKQLEGLLLMLAKLSPWSIVYPTLVDIDACEQEPSEELQHVLACLSKLYPRLIQDVQLVIKELENVTVLWEELWLSTLQDLHADVMRRIHLLKEEAARIVENITLSHSEKSKINAAKYSAMMAPIVVALERRLASTSRKPETPHEIWFHKEYKEQLKSAILNFKTPPASAAALGDVWRPFDSIASSLASYQRKSSISLGEVAPQLAQLSSSDVPMPGLEKQITISESNGDLTSSQGIVTIASFTEQVVILSTKTKPKKLVIMGSDGHKYTYLLKGREDLRLDARIMQLLQAINGFLYSSRTTRSQPLSIRYYSVTPISGRAGLIQWVDNVISIYSVFKSWQNHEQLAQLQALGAGNMKNSVPPPVPRPTDMFYGKIIPALKEKGIRRVISRKDWPHEVKWKVLLDLMKEAPKQLLHQELWCASEGFKAFSLKLRRYSGSVAAMSMVGHILGLGDRHLDNILIDFLSGDIVHIDYNVCFDKGQRLKIPEIVPFRLTQTIEAALGLTGIEGIFRANCEAVLDVLRENKDIILMLLEVFVWDPLVEWTRGDVHDDAAIVGEERKGMELAVSLSLFASRVQEIRVPLQEHHDLLLGTLPAVESALERFASMLNQYELVSTLFYHADQERSNLVLHETSAKSIIAEATCNSEKTRASFEIQAREFAQAKAIVAEIAQEATTWIEQHGRILDALRSSSIPEIKTSMQLMGMEEALSLTSAVHVAGVPLTIVPEPTQAQCQDIDREVSQLVSELDHGLSSAVTAVQAYSLALQRILPINYLTTSPLHGWAQILQLSVNSLSSDVLSLARRQAAELIANVHADGSDSSRSSYDNLCLKVENYAEEIERVEKDYAELMNSIGAETESRAKDRLLSAFMKYMQSAGLARKEDATSVIHVGALKHDATRDARLQGEIVEKREKILTVLNIAVSALYSEVRQKVLNILSHPPGRSTENVLQPDFYNIFSELEEQIEKCVLVTGFVNELKQYAFGDLPSGATEDDHASYFFQRNWASIFKTALLSCKNLIGKMIEVVLPDVVRSVVSFNSEVMDAFGSLSQIRGSIDTALEQLVEVELERVSLLELEQNYFVKVGLITEQQLALEEAAVKGRDHLSWEEAEELVSQEEACREQLDKLHQTWNQKDMRTSSLVKREAGIRSALFSSENHFQSLTSAEQEGNPHIMRTKALLAALVEPFTELEAIDKTLATLGGPVTSYSSVISCVANLVTSGCPISEYIWKFPSLMNKHSFFIWKVSVVDSLLDSCIHDTASSVDQNLGFDQLLGVLKKKLEIHLQNHVNQYLKEQVGPILLARLDKENELLKQLTETGKELAVDQAKQDFGAVRRVQLMLGEYCNAHETARAARSAASLMKRQVNGLKEVLRKTSLEIVQMEWMHDVTLNPLHNVRLICHKLLGNDDNLFPVILNISRRELLERIQSSVSKIARSLECLQACERTSSTAEGQLERAMGWACGGPSSGIMGSGSARNSGIPPEFRSHLMRRQELLWEAREKASDIIKICMSILEFEESRDGIFQTSGELYPFRTGADARTWQQAYLNALTRLDVTYHSFARTEQEWKLAQNNMEAASSGLFSATNELCIASAKAKSASGDLQSTLVAMRDCAYEVSAALSAFGRVLRGHTALTSECAPMLEEVLAIAEGLHDFQSLGKEAAAVHSSLMNDLSKASAILLPLESVLSKDVSAMTDAMARERETKMEISPIHGQAIYQSYNLRIRDACQAFKPLISPLIVSVKGLHAMLIRLARTASLHAGNLHKALEGLGESQEIRSPDINLSRPVIADHDSDYDSKEGEVFLKSDGENDEDNLGVGGAFSQDKGWISPPDSICSSSSESGITSAEASLLDSFNDQEFEKLALGASSTEAQGHFSSAPLSGSNLPEMSDHVPSVFIDKKTNDDDIGSVDECKKPGKSSYSESEASGSEPSHSVNQGDSQVKFRLKEEPSLLKQEKAEDQDRETVVPTTDVGKRVARGKNAYAMSVLKRVEMKLEGRDISDNRVISIAEQVDYLLKQATSVDNLCNMYEGWTPWI
ncbi:Non-specific serine/threonine protein kinase [Bertholletia excelsa]